MAKPKKIVKETTASAPPKAAAKPTTDVDAALLDLFNMFEFFNNNPNWNIQDYITDPHLGFSETELGKLVAKARA